MSNETNHVSIQERQDVDVWVKRITTALGFVLLVFVLSVVVLYVLNKNDYPKPVDIEAALLFGFGILLIALFNLPWSKIRIGDLEIERVIEEQSQEYTEEIERLKKELQRYEEILEQSKETSPEVKMNIEASKQARAQSNKDEELVLEFLEAWSTWGFTATRIKKWGGNKSGFTRFSEMGLSELKLIANELVGKGKIRSRISTNGNVLYQAIN